jgi:hypothetical protein
VRNSPGSSGTAIPPSQKLPTCPSSGLSAASRNSPAVFYDADASPASEPGHQHRPRSDQSAPPAEPVV